VSCAVAGLNGEPAFGPEGGADGGNDINPAAPGDIRLNGPKTVNTGSNVVEVAFQNLNSEDTKITDARINFYQSNGGKTPQEAVIAASQGGDSGTLPIGSPFQSVNPQITLAGSSESTVWLDFDTGVQKSDWFVLTLQFDNDEVGQYFISLRDDATDGGTTPAGSGFNTVSASDFKSNKNQKQDLTFELDSGLSDGETVEIDLSNAAAGGVDYSSANAESEVGSTTINENVVTYESSGDSSGDEINIEVSKINGQSGSGSFTADFTRSDKTDAASNDFNVG
jgi:hypothetical protein